MDSIDKKSVLCSYCKSEIEKNYCEQCGQYYNSKRLNAAAFLSDFLDAFLSLHKSYGMNLKYLLLQPRFVVENYWKGFRNVFFSPNRMLLLTSFVLGLYLLFSKNTFLGIGFKMDGYPWIGIQFIITVLFLFLFIISTLITYYKRKKNIFEHLALHAYVFSLSAFIIIILSFPFEYLQIVRYLQIIFIIFHFIWVAKVFETTWKRILKMAALNLLVFLCITLLPIAIMLLTQSYLNPL